MNEKSRRAFTLLELLVVVGIIGILASLLLPALGMSKEQVRRTSCRNNLRQLVMASLMYSSDDAQGNFSAALWEGDRDLNYLFPTYIQTVQLFVCPGTRNRIRTVPGRHELSGQPGLYDLFHMASDRKSTVGMSYLLSGFMGWKTPYHTMVRVNERWNELPFVKKTADSVNSYRHFHSAFGLKGTIPGPSQIALILDNSWSGNQDYPDRDDNHGSAGGNFGFCDGHVEWVSRSQYLFVHERSQDDDRSAVEYKH